MNTGQWASLLPGIEYKLTPVEGIDAQGGSVGKLFVRGKNVMKGYLKNEAANPEIPRRGRGLVRHGGYGGDHARRASSR